MAKSAVAPASVYKYERSKSVHLIIKKATKKVAKGVNAVGEGVKNAVKDVKEGIKEVKIENNKNK